MSIKLHITDRQVCAAYSLSKDGDLNIIRWPYEILMEVTGESEAVCFAACERACDKGLIDFGVSLRSGWLTDAGRKLLDTPDGNNS